MWMWRKSLLRSCCWCIISTISLSSIILRSKIVGYSSLK
jgi:hypothetical protein